MMGVDDVLQVLNYLGGIRLEQSKNVERALPEGRTEDEAVVLECFRGGSTFGPDAISGLRSRGISEVDATLTMFELKRLVRKRSDA